MKKTFSLCVVVIFSLFILNSCSKEDTNPSDRPTHQSIPGMGETPGELEGSAFSLPNGIELVGDIRGYYDGTPCDELGTGSYVTPYLTLKNTTASNITVTFPAGLVFKSLSSDDQSGLIIQDATVSIAAGVSCLIIIQAYCANASRGASSNDSRYAFGPITNAPELLYLINLCKNKNIEASDLQTTIWKITDIDGLEDSDIDYINKLPNK